MSSFYSNLMRLVKNRVTMSTLLVFLCLLGQSWSLASQCKESNRSGSLAVSCFQTELTRVPKLPNAGVISDLSLERNNITILELGAFDEYPALEQLELLFCGLREIKAGAFGKLINLKKLKLGYNQISLIEKGTFDELQSLISLTMGENKLTRIQAGLFSGTPNLEDLWLARNKALSVVERGSFSGLTSLKKLDIGLCDLSSLTTGLFSDLIKLQKLLLHSNRIASIEDGTFDNLSSLTELDLGFNRLTAINSSTLGALGNLTKLWLYSNQLTAIQRGAFEQLKKLQVLDLRKNKLKVIGPYVFRSLPSNLTVYSEDADLCCIVGDSGLSCEWPKKSVYWLDGYGFVKGYPIQSRVDSTFSSCQDLMHNKTLGFFIWMLGIFGVVCNVGVIVWRLSSRYRVANRDLDETQSKANVLSICLALGDLCMGVFLLIIATADQVFRGYYVFQDLDWKRSAWCSMAGFLSAFSSEYTVFILTVMTIDRCFAVAYPTRHHFLNSFDVKVVAVGLFIVAALLASAPLMTSDLPHFYNVSGVCLALPFFVQPANSSVKPSLQMSGPSWNYSFSVFIGLNSISVFTILVCYVKIFQDVVESSKTTTNTSTNTEAKIGKRIMMIVATDMACWLPIIVLGLMSAAGIGLPPTVYAWVAVFILPINSAINPLIYTFYTRQFQQALNKARLRLETLWSSEKSASRMEIEMK